MNDELFDAIDSHDVNQVAAVLRAGADPNATLSKEPNWRPLGAAIEELEFGGSVAVIRTLLAAGADVNLPYIGDRLMPLDAAMCSQNIDVLKLLLEAGADANALNNEDNTPLRFAVEENALAMAALLLKHGARASIDESGGFCGLTALGLAVQKLNLPMVRMLLESGADPQALDSDGRSALEHLPSRATANLQTWDEVIKLLAGNGL